MNLMRWRRSFQLTAERTIGQLGLRKNGTNLDIWLRVDGVPRRFSVNRAELSDSLASVDAEHIIYAESDGNSEASFEEDAATSILGARP